MDLPFDAPSDRRSNPRPRRAWTALVAVALLSAVAGAQPKDKALADLEARLTGARRAMEDAERQLETTYLRMEADFERLRGDLAPFVDAVCGAVRIDADDVRELLTNGRGGRTPTRNAQLLLAAERLAATLEAVEIDPAFRVPLSRRLSEPLLDTLLSPDLPGLRQRADDALGQLFRTDAEFAQVWNDQLFKHVAEADAYAKARQGYLEAGQQLEVARSPERFDASGNRLPPGMVQVTAGSYTIGPHHGWERKGFEKRSKKVSLRAFYIDRDEVTNAQYVIFWKQLPLEEQLQHLPRFWEEAADGTFQVPAGKEEHPVVGVTFNDALRYAEWAGKRLPTEDEWEAAARGSQAFKFPWGDDYQPGYANDRDTGIGDTTPVGSFPQGASPVGCLDMAGNVEEWTASSSEDEILTKPVTSNLVQVVIRGGNFDASPEGINTTFRWVSPGLSTRKAKLGFRCAMDVPKR